MTSRQKNIKSVILGLFVMFMAVGIAATNKYVNSDDEIACIEFTGVDIPSDIQVIVEASFEPVTALTCDPFPATLCGVCVNSEEFTLVDGMPDFSDPGLIYVLQNYGLNPINHNKSFLTPDGRSVTLHFRAEK